MANFHIMDWCLAILLLFVGLIMPIGGSTVNRQRRQTDQLCSAGETEIAGPWIWTDDDNCVSLIAKNPDLFESDIRNREECARWLDLSVVPDRVALVYIPNSDCFDLGNGTTRYRASICCEGETTEQRCFTCNQVPFAKDSILLKMWSEECNYYSPMTTCASGEVCQSQSKYYLDGNGQEVYEVTKTCADPAACDALQDQDICKNYQPVITCTECCSGPFCNYDSKMPKYVPEELVTEWTCENGGTPYVNENTTSGYACHCLPGTLGDQCEEDMCNLEPCEHNGECATDTTYPYYECTCKAGLAGVNCNETVPECPPQSPPYCDNGGTCYDHGVYGYFCKCPDNYYGTYCQLGGLQCDSDILHRIRSEDFRESKGSLRNCEDSYDLVQSSKTNKLQKKKCLSHMGGTYVDGSSFGAVNEIPVVDIYRCEAAPDGSGFWLTIQQCCPSCFSSPCQNDGRCIPNGQAYVCKCRFGYEGDNCEVESAVCMIYGDPNYLTFDGAMTQFHGGCTYEAVSLKTSIEGIPDFKVTVRHEQDAVNPDFFKIGFIQLDIYGCTIRLAADKVVTVDGNQVFPDAYFDEFKVINNGLFVRVQTDFNLILEYDGVSVGLVKVPRSIFVGALSGMCGDFNEDSSNDYITKDGQNVSGLANMNSILGNSWQVVDPEFPGCVGPAEDLDPCSAEQTATYSAADQCGYIQAQGSPFEGCLEGHNELGQTFLETCLYDSCSKDPAKALCATLEALTTECLTQGVFVDTATWRADFGCYPDCGVDMEYKTLTPACPMTCQNPSAPDLCPLPDTEGCACVDEKSILKNGVCVAPEECKCVDTEGVEQEVGAVWYTENCEKKVECVLCTDCDPQVPLPQETMPGCPPDQKCTNVSGVLGCEDRCPSDQVWQPMNADCQASCSDQAVPTSCEAGCRCAQGVLDDAGNCVDPNSCGCQDDQGVMHTAPSTWNIENCVTMSCDPCAEGDADCLGPTISTVADGCQNGTVCRFINDQYVCTEECDADKVYVTGVSVCLATCTDPRAPDTCASDLTEDGCRCPGDQLQDEDSLCRDPPDCGCMKPDKQRMPIGANYATEDCQIAECIECDVSECGANIGKLEYIPQCNANETCSSTCDYDCPTPGRR